MKKKTFKKLLAQIKGAAKRVSEMQLQVLHYRNAALHNEIKNMKAMYERLLTRKTEHIVKIETELKAERNTSAHYLEEIRGYVEQIKNLRTEVNTLKDVKIGVVFNPTDNYWQNYDGSLKGSKSAANERDPGGLRQGGVKIRTIEVKEDDVEFGFWKKGQQYKVVDGSFVPGVGEKYWVLHKVIDDDKPMSSIEKAKCDIVIGGEDWYAREAKKFQLKEGPGYTSPLKVKIIKSTQQDWWNMYSCRTFIEVGFSHEPGKEQYYELWDELTGPCTVTHPQFIPVECCQVVKTVFTPSCSDHRVCGNCGKNLAAHLYWNDQMVAHCPDN